MSTVARRRRISRVAVSIGRSKRGPNFRTVWASLQETDRLIKERAEEFEREKKEKAAEYEREKKEKAAEYEREKKEKAAEYEREKKESEREKKEMERRIKESEERLNKQLSKLGGRFGEMIEYMVLPNLVHKFRDLGFEFTKAYPEAEIKDSDNNIFTEIDITLENGDKVMIVEVKSKPNINDIKDHVRRMKKVRRHGDLHGDKRKFLGAIAGMVFKDNVKTFAMKNGFYLIVPSGETFIITVPEGEYSPREW